jgi:hypothetical protein
MAHTKSLRTALRALVLALSLSRRGVVGQTFVTALSGLGGTPVGATPLNTPGASVMQLISLANVDSDAVCNGASVCPRSARGGVDGVAV